jgi:hypothetical protein
MCRVSCADGRTSNQRKMFSSRGGRHRQGQRPPRESLKAISHNARQQLHPRTAKSVSRSRPQPSGVRAIRRPNPAMPAHCRDLKASLASRPRQKAAVGLRAAPRQQAKVRLLKCRPNVRSSKRCQGRAAARRCSVKRNGASNREAAGSDDRSSTNRALLEG